MLKVLVAQVSSRLVLNCENDSIISDNKTEILITILRALKLDLFSDLFILFYIQSSSTTPSSYRESFFQKRCCKMIFFLSEPKGKGV